MSTKSDLLVRISGLILIWIHMCTELLPECCGFIALSLSVILPNFIKMGQWTFEKRPKMPYGDKMEKWSRCGSGLPPKVNDSERVLPCSCIPCLVAFVSYPADIDLGVTPIYFSHSLGKKSCSLSLARSDFCATGNRQELCWNLHVIGLLFRAFFKDFVLVGKRG